MDILEYIRELGCEMENAMDSAIAQGMAEAKTEDERHRIVQRNFISAKLADAQHFAHRLTSLLREDEELLKLQSLKNFRSHEDAFTDLLQSIEKIETSDAKKNIAFARQHKARGMDPSDDAVEKQFFHRTRMPIDIPNEHTPIVHGQFGPEEGFGRYTDFQTPYKAYRSLVKSIRDKISLNEEERGKLSDLAYTAFVSGIETHFSNFPQRVKYGVFTDSEALSAEEAQFLKSDFLPKYAAYLHQLGDYCKRSHLKVFPLDVDLVESERTKFPSVLSSYFTDTTRYVVGENESESFVTAEFVHAAEERVRFWLRFLEEKVQATIRMFERRQILTPEEIEAEELRGSLALRKSLCASEIPSWAYILPQKESLKALGSAIEIPEPSTEAAESPAQPENVIPLWLRKINGLSVRLFCQVCNQTYAGPTIFEQHFKEFRHSQCLSRLGIINVPAMHGVDTIDEARKLWQKIIAERKRKNSFWTTQDMEFEDEFGEVVTKKIAA